MWFITHKLFFNKVDKEKGHNGHRERQMALLLSLLSKQHEHSDFVVRPDIYNVRCQLCHFFSLTLPLSPAMTPPPEMKKSSNRIPYTHQLHLLAHPVNCVATTDAVGTICHHIRLTSHYLGKGSRNPQHLHGESPFDPSLLFLFS